MTARAGSLLSMRLTCLSRDCPDRVGAGQEGVCRGCGTARRATRPAAARPADGVRRRGSLRARGRRMSGAVCGRRLRSAGGGSGPRAARPRLAPRAGVRRAVHEGLSPDGCPAPLAGATLLAVGVERPVEVAGGAVDVDVERVEARPARERLEHDVTGVVEQPAERGPGQRGAQPFAVDLRPPEGLVGVDVPDPETSVWSSRARLTAVSRVFIRRTTAAWSAGSSGSGAMWAIVSGTRTR